MSTQDDSGIPFEISNEQESFRLLELPPALLELVTSKRLSNLTLKSAALDATEDSSQTPTNVVLCTDNQTYQVRQVQSSNSVFVLQTSGTEPRENSIPSSSLSAIAKCTATLELIPTTPSATGFLRHAVPIYWGTESHDESGIATKILGATTKATLLDDAPFSSRELDKAWKELCVFEEDSQAWLPTALVLNGVWKSIISAATVRSMNLGESFSMTTLGGIAEEDGYSDSLLKAVIDRLGSDDESDLMDEYAVLSRENAIPWVGVVLLQSQCASAEGTPTSRFLQEWQNQLPESWREQATLEVLKGKYSEPSKGNIVFDESTGEPAGSKVSVPTKTGGKGAKNWHEKFKSARR